MELTKKIILIACGAALLFYVSVQYMKDQYVNANEIEDCNSRDIERILSGCGAVIRKEPTARKKVLAIAYLRRSIVYLRRDDLDKAISDLSRVVNLEPENTTYKSRLYGAYAYRAKRHLDNNELDNAIADFEVANTFQSDNKPFNIILLNLYHLRGLEHLLNENFTDAVILYTKAIEIDNKDVELYMNLAEAYVGEGFIGSAIRNISTAINLKHDYIEGYKRRGELYMSLGLNVKAIADYSEALNINPKQIQVLLSRALLFEKQGSYFDAGKDYSEILKLDQKNKEAKVALRRLLKNKILIAKLYQIKLANAGCYTGKIDGVWGASSRAAMLRLKKQTGYSGEFRIDSLYDLERLKDMKGKKCSVIEVGTASKKELEFDWGYER